MKTINNMITTRTIKKTLYILAAFLGLQFNTIFANGNFSDSAAFINSAVKTNNTESLAPIAPKEASFEEVYMLNDGAPVLESSTQVLAPITPAEADFEDVSGVITAQQVNALAPATPAEADFEESL